MGGRRRTPHPAGRGTGDMTTVTTAQKWRNLGRAAGTGALLLAAAGLAALSLVTGFGDHNYADFHIFWRAGHDVLNGLTPYPRPAASELRAQNQFVYPAPAAVAMAPFALLSLPVSATVFLILSIACVGACLWIVGVRDIRCYALAAGSLPVIQGVVMGTVTPVLMLLLALAWWKRDSVKWIAVTAAAAVAIKLFVLPIGLWLLATRRLRATGAAVIASVGLLAAGWLVVGLHTATSYPHLLSSLTTVEGGYGYALYALALRAGASAAVAKLASVVAVAGLGFLVFSAGRRHDRAAFALAVVACLACSPIVWNHYFGLLIVAIAVLRPRLSWLWALLPAFWLIPNANHPAPTWKIVGAQLACAIVVAVAVRESRRPAPAEPAVVGDQPEVEVLRLTHPAVAGTQPQAPR
jgi:hypothetical protein